MKKRFSMGKDESDFTQPCKLTKQKRQTENLEELERYQHKALCMKFSVKIEYIRNGSGG